MRRDAFSNCHPAVNLCFFLGAIAFGVTIQHPAYLVTGILAALAYYFLLKGRKGVRSLLWMLPLFAVTALINPLLNLQGERVLFHVFGRPYTLEALFYGIAIGGTFFVMLLWFGCYNTVMTGDKFTALLGNVIPALSLLLVMVLRMIPNLIRKAGQITGARKSIGKGSGENSSKKERLMDGLTVLSALTSYALEGSVVTADSMRSRGYGSSKRSSFQLYRMTSLDWMLLCIMLVLAVTVVAFVVSGSATASYTPELEIAPLRGRHIIGFIAYCAYLFIPTVLHSKEAIQWHISRSKI